MLPRDFHVADRTGKIRLARLFSNVVSPPTIFAVIGLAFALKELPFVEGIAWAAVYGFWVSLFPILFVLLLLKRGHIQELHMSNTSERRWPYVMAVVGSAVAWLLLNGFQGPQLLVCLTVFNMLELAALAFITTWWLISMHTTAVTALFMLVGLVWSWTAAVIIVIPIILSVSYVRLYLRRHTPLQVVAGMLLGVVSVWVLIPWGCFGG